MREQEMRRRIEGFLRARVRTMVAPAALGLGLALSGCNGDALSSNDDASADAHAGAAADTAAPAVKYMAQLPDAGPELPQPQPDYMAVMPDAGIFVRYGSPNVSDGGRDFVSVPMYFAQLPTSRG